MRRILVWRHLPATGVLVVLILGGGALLGWSYSRGPGRVIATCPRLRFRWRTPPSPTTSSG